MRCLPFVSCWDSTGPHNGCQIALVHGQPTNPPACIRIGLKNGEITWKLDFGQLANVSAAPSPPFSDTDQGAKARADWGGGSRFRRLRKYHRWVLLYERMDYLPLSPQFPFESPSPSDENNGCRAAMMFQESTNLQSISFTVSPSLRPPVRPSQETVGGARRAACFRVSEDGPRRGRCGADFTTSRREDIWTSYSHSLSTHEHFSTSIIRIIIIEYNISLVEKNAYSWHCKATQVFCKNLPMPFNSYSLFLTHKCSPALWLGIYNKNTQWYEWVEEHESHVWISHMNKIYISKSSADSQMSPLIVSLWKCDLREKLRLIIKYSRFWIKCTKK